VIAQSGSRSPTNPGTHCDGQSNPECQRKAVEYLECSAEARPKTLAEVYAKTSDESRETRHSEKLHDFRHKEDLFRRPRMKMIYHCARDRPFVSSDSCNGVSELEQLYQKRKLDDVKQRNLQAFFLAGDSGRWSKPRKARGPELRRAAVRNMGLINFPDSSKALQTIYTKEPIAACEKKV